MGGESCKVPYILGLDIGMASVGAALLADDRILGLHVRAFNKAETAKEGESLNKIRRDSRLTRRRLHRRAFRLLRLRRLFKRTGLLASNSVTAFVGETSPWQLRAEGLDRLLSPEEWAAVLYHLLKHRGFQSTRKSEAKADEKAGQMLTGVSHNSQLLKAADYRTVGELAWKHASFRATKRNKSGSYAHTFARADIEVELRLLFVAQRAVGNPHVSQVFERDVHTLLMARRPALSGNALLDKVGPCTFEPQEKRIPKACYTAELFVWLTRLNNLRIHDQGVNRPLNAEERQAVLLSAFSHGKVTYKQVRAKAELPDSARFVGVDYWKKRTEGNELAAEDAALFEAKHFHDLRKAYEKAGLKLEWQRDSQNPQRLDTLMYALTVFKEDIESRCWLLEQGIELPIIEAVLELSYSKFLHLSRTALLKIIPFMEQGQRYDEAVQSAGYAHHSQKAASRQSRLLPAFSKEDIINPVVYRSLNQARKLVNAIVQQYGSPSAVHIELARDLSKPFDERRRIEREQKEFRDNKLEDISQFVARFGFEPKGLDLLKWRLYREQDCKCAYSLQPFDLHRLYEEGYAEVDHALPYSRSFDNGMNNKVLVFTTENRNKGNRTPYEYLDGKNDSQQWREFSAFVTGNKKIRQAKRMKLLRKDFGKDEAEKFRDRNLTDTRYACTLFKNHVETHLQLVEGSGSKRCVVVSGQLTAFLRARWGLLKVRADGDLHHALDAAVVAACSHAFVQRLARYSQRGELQYLNTHTFDPETGEVVDIVALRQVEKDFPQPWVGFRKELNARLSADPANVLSALEGVMPVRVSRAPQRRGTGAAHKETIYGQPKRLQAENSVTQRVAVTDLKLSDIDNLVDPHRNVKLYAALREWVASREARERKAKEIEKLARDEKRALELAEKTEIDRLRALPQKPDKYGKATGPIVRSVNKVIKNLTGIPVRGGVAKNDSQVRADIFTDGKRFYAVPLYVADVVKNNLPNKAILAGKPDNEWTEMDENYRFLFSLHANDWVRVTIKGKPVIEGYYAAISRSTGAVDIWVHDRNRNIGRSGKEGLIEGIGIKTALSVEKFHVDMLGNIYPARNETRHPLQSSKKR